MSRASITKSILIAFFVAFISFFVSYMVNVALANLLTEEQYGDFSVAYYWTKFFATAAVLGGVKAIPKFFPEYKGRDFSHGSGLLIFYTLMSVFIGLFIAVVCLFVSYLDIHVFTEIGYKEYHPIVIALFLIPFIAVSQINGAVLQTRHQFFWAQSSVRVFPFILFLILLWIVWEADLIDNVWHAFELFILAYIILLLGQFFLISKLSNIDYSYKIARFAPKKWLGLSLPIMSVSLVFALICQIDITMVEFLEKSEKLLAYFAAALNIATLLWVGGGATNLVMLPLLAEATTKSKKEAEKVYRTHTLFSTLLGGLITLLIIIFGKQFLTMFGRSYFVAYASTIILSFAFLTKVIGASTVYVLEFYSLRAWLIGIEVSSIVIVLVLNIILIPIYHIEGAAIATLIGMGSGAIAKLLTVRYQLGLRLF